MVDELPPPLFEVFFPVEAAKVETENIDQLIINATDNMNLRKEKTLLSFTGWFYSSSSDGKNDIVDNCIISP